MKKLSIIFIIITALIFFCVEMVLADDYFLRPKGSTYGSGAGTSYENAWSGLGNVKWDQLGAGDTLYVCGTITGEYFNIASNGSSGSYLVIDGGYSSDPGVVDAQQAQSHAIRCSEREYVTIKNLALKNGSSTGISVGSSQFVTIDNVIIDNSGNIGMLITCPNVIIKNCTVTNSVHTGCQITQSPYALLEKITVENCGQTGQNDDCIFIGDGSTNFLVNECVVRNNFSNGTGFDCSGDVNNPISGTFRYCWAEEMKGGGAYCAGAGTERQMKVKFEYCVAKECLGPPFAAKESVTAEFYNCVAYVTQLCNYLPINLSGWYDRHSRNLVVKNCIFMTNSTRPMFAIRINDTLVSSNNCWYNFSAASDFMQYIYEEQANLSLTWSAWQDKGFDSGSFYQDPGFVNPVVGDFSLKPDSPCIDAGADIGIAKDFAGVQVPQGGKTDMGIKEFLVAQQTISPPKSLKIK